MTIEIAIHCYNYQRRLCWMLSSILQQEGDAPEIVVSISYTEGNGDPTTTDVIKFFKKKGLNIISVPLDQNQVHNRAIPRNMRAKDTKADWILYADSDMVYSPLFFDDLKKQLEGELKDETRVMGADRHSLDIPFCIKYFEEDEREYPSVVENVVEIPKDWPKKWISGRKTAAGYFQLANVQAMIEKGRVLEDGTKEGVYSGRQRDRWRLTRSDRQFRVHMGGRRPIIVLPQYHLNHDRGGPEIQR